ncbi:MAG: FkbM family methyltransferase [Limisphaerales bacterium]
MPFGDQIIRLDETLRRWNLQSEIQIQNVMRQELRPGDCMLDVGANFGLHTLLAGKLVGPQGAVYSFEPVPKSIQMLRHHLALNKLQQIVQIVSAAVSDSCATHVSFFSGADEFDLTASLVGGAGNTRRQRVANIRLDDFVATIKRPVKLVKIDVEGAELNVLRGSQMLLKRDRPIMVIEVHNFAFDDFKTSINEYKSFIESMGYDEEIIPGTILRKDLHYQTLCRPQSNQ